MDKNLGLYFLLNGKTTPIENFTDYCLNIRFEVYEVIRIVKGIPLFCEDHFSRMMGSLQLLNKSINLKYSEFENQIKTIAEKNNILNGNVKISIGEQTRTIVMQFIPHHYPTDDEYLHGVKTGLFSAERTNPNVKAHLIDLRKKVDVHINTTGFFEVIYVDRNNTITEGSRTNVFFIRDGKVYTCRSEKVLLGITRQKVIECLKNLDIPLIETNILKNEINSFDSVFLTGTSPKILPVASIDETTFSCTNETMTKIRLEYDRMIDQYINSKLP